LPAPQQFRRDGRQGNGRQRKRTEEGLLLYAGIVSRVLGGIGASILLVLADNCGIVIIIDFAPIAIEREAFE
jgi:hypothetical protein